MMVLRHMTPPSATIVTHEESSDDEDSSPIDLSNKHFSPSDTSRNFNNKSHVFSQPRYSLASPTFPTSAQKTNSRFCRTDPGLPGELRLRESEPLEGIEENDELVKGFGTNDHGKPNFIPLSRIRFHQRRKEQLLDESAEDDSVKSESATTEQVLTKRARLDCLISHIKQSKPLERSEPSSDEDHPGLHSEEQRRDPAQELTPFNLFGMDKFQFRVSEENDSCNASSRKECSLLESSLMDACKNKLPLKGISPLSPSEAVKIYGGDPETYQQQLMQLQLSSTSPMLGDASGFLKTVQNFPPWVYLGYYSQIVQQHFQAQEILRQYAIQSSNTHSTVSFDEKNPNASSMSTYNCMSPKSPTSLSEAQFGGDSDGGSVGQMTTGSVNGKRAPRAMTGRHVRTGTGASPSTLETLRRKIEERQRLKAQLLRPKGVKSRVNCQGTGAVRVSHNSHSNNKISPNLHKKSKK